MNLKTRIITKFSLLREKYQKWSKEAEENRNSLEYLKESRWMLFGIIIFYFISIPYYMEWGHWVTIFVGGIMLVIALGFIQLKIRKKQRNNGNS